MTDNVIIQRLKAGDEEGLSLLIDQYSRYVSAVLCNLARGSIAVEDVEELAADVFVSVWKHRDGLRDGAPLKPYLARIARNAAVSRLRALGQSSVPLDEDILISAPDSPPDELAARREQSALLNQLVEDLTEPDREIFLRFYYFGEKIQAIANRLNLNAGTVKTKLRRSRNKLKQSFEERGYCCEDICSPQ